jgi:hypothetical protein
LQDTGLKNGNAWLTQVLEESFVAGYRSRGSVQYLKNLFLQDTGLNLVPKELFTAGYRTNKAMLGSPEIS